MAALKRLCFLPPTSALRRLACMARHITSQRVVLNYQSPPPPGKSTGRYINQPDKGDVADVHEAHETDVWNARLLTPQATLESYGFELLRQATACGDFRDDAEVKKTYYAEIRELVKRASGATRVLIFDHTIRESGNTNLNAQAGGSAAPVPRVHCDYTATGAPRRLEQLGSAGIHSLQKDGKLSPEEMDSILAGRFAFLNIWRSIDPVNPVKRNPLAVCDERTVPLADRFLYELRFPDRTGENYSLKFSADHKWYYYPEMAPDECLMFKVHDKKEDGPRFVFHTAFEDPLTTEADPPRRSIEVRSIAIFDSDAALAADCLTLAE
eukprot:TRINITY_DN84712_c0_g1_i1.p1 TRINITY_DN84712_c0_g1~~TRINITY_DN84712_c0_g1_i1.p1  ORF type:complete len:340 (+),score=63.79 TRINITY_DN84712_c0_g1_i1:46-1020(+)